MRVEHRRGVGYTYTVVPLVMNRGPWTDIVCIIRGIHYKEFKCTCTN